MEKNQSLKEKIKQETQGKLVSAGIDAFAEFGYHGMKIAAVARDAGVANGTYYLYFKNKRMLFVEIIRKGVAELASGIFASRNYSNREGGSEGLELEVVIKFAENNSKLMRILLDPHAQTMLEGTDLFEPLVIMRQKELNQGIREGRINRSINPLIAARAEIGMILSTVSWWVNSDSKESREDLLETLSHLRRSWAVLENTEDNIDVLLEQWGSKLK